MTRKEAKETKAKTYTGLPCKRCGNIEKYTSCGNCILCNIAIQTESYFRRKPDPNFYKNTATYRQRQATYQKERRKLPGIQELYRDHRLKNLYNLSIKDYESISISQNGVCAICKKPESEIVKSLGRPRRLHVDHNHQTNKIRGLLCKRCNICLGAVNEDKEILINMIKYIEKYEAV